MSKYTGSLRAADETYKEYAQRIAKQNKLGIGTKTVKQTDRR